MNHHEGRLPTTMAISGISDRNVGFRFRPVFFTMSSPILTHRLDTPVDQGIPFRLGIVIPLKPRAIARCWPEVEKRLRATVASLRRQSSAAWEAMIVGHERPELGEWHLPNLSFITVDQPPPTPGPGARITRRSSSQDKSAKLAFGMRCLSATGNITHWLHLDADDLLHEHFVTTVSRMVPFDISIVRRGYAYYPYFQRSMRLDRIDRFCGSTVLTSDRWWIDPASPEGRRYTNIPHRRADEYAVLRGARVKDYPDRGVAYVLGHGDNLYRTIGRRVRVWLEGQFLARRDDAEFIKSFGPEGDR